MNIFNRKITIVGAQRSGMALAELVHRKRGWAKMTEQSSSNGVDKEFQEWARNQDIPIEFGGHTQPFVEDSDMVVLSPGVPFDSQVVQWAQQKNIPVLGEIEFASQYCFKPIIAITGSNGKTTVSTLIHQVLEAAGFSATLCGNVGDPFSDYVDDLCDTDFVVLEVSSFQLEPLLDPTEQPKVKGFRGFKPHIALLLNVSQNHLDRHKDFQDYLRIKKRIFLNQSKNDFAVLNFLDEHLLSLETRITPQIVYFNSTNDRIGNVSTCPNQLAVLQVANILGIGPTLAQKVFRQFDGVEHRLEFVRSLRGIDFINDSKATTAEASRWALRSMNRPVIMICGGRDKNIDFTVLRGEIKEKVKKLFVIGEAGEKIRQAFSGLVGIEKCDALENAVEQANQCAEDGDCVIMSPMCTSFDMFLNYEERGESYKRIVGRLK